MRMTFVFDQWTEKTGVYIDSMLRAEAEAGEFDLATFMDAYDLYSPEAAVILERVTIDTRDEDYEFPEQLGEAICDQVAV